MEEASSWKTGFILTSKRSSEMVLELPELARENQNWQIYRAHILDSAAAEGVVSHLTGAAPKPVDSRELEAWNWSNSVAKYIIQDVISDSLLARLMHHELAHTLFSHLAAIFGDLKPIALETPAEQSDQDEPLRKDSHPKLDGTYSARTAEIVKGIHVEGAGTATEIPDTPPYAPDGLSCTDRNQEKEHSGRERNAHDTDRESGHSSLTSTLKTTKIYDKKPSGTTPAGIPIIPSILNTNSTTIYPKDPGDPPNVPDGTSRGDDHKTAESGGQWQRTMRKVTRNNKTALPAPNLADRTSEEMTGDDPIPSSQTQPINAVKHQRMSTRYIPLPIGCANTNAQRSNGHPKPKIHLPRQHRLPLDREKYGVTTNGYTPSSSGQSMPQKLTCTPNEPNTLVTISIESETPCSGEIPQVRLASVHWHTDDANGPGRRTEMSKGQADESEGRTDESRARADASTTPNEAKTVVVSHRTGAGTYLSTGDTKCTVDETDGIDSHADVSSGHRDAPTTSNGAKRAGISYGDEPDTYLSIRDANRTVNETDGIGSHADASTGHEDAHSVQTDALTPGNTPETVSMRPIESKLLKPLTIGANSCANETDGSRHHPSTLNMRMHAVTPADEVGNISMHPNEQKRPNPPAGSTKSRPEEPNSFGNHTGTLGTCTDGHSVTNDPETAASASRNISSHQNSPKTRNSPHTHETATPESTYQWKRVSLRGIDIYVPLNAPIDSTSRIFIFGRVEGGVKAIAPSIEGKRVGDRVGNRDEWNGDVDGTTSGGSIDSKRVKTALLAVNSQHTRYRSRARGNGSPVSSWTPIQPTDRPYRLARRQR